MMNHDEQKQLEQRQEYRLLDNESVFLELADEDSEKPVIAVCNSVDISTNGLQVALTQDLAIGSIHQLCIQLEEPDCRLLLVAEVMWSKPSPENTDKLIGLSILESDNTDIQRWKNIISERYQLTL